MEGGGMQPAGFESCGWNTVGAVGICSNLHKDTTVVLFFDMIASLGAWCFGGAEERLPNLSTILVHRITKPLVFLYLITIFPSSVPPSPSHSTSSQSFIQYVPYFGRDPSD